MRARSGVMWLVTLAVLAAVIAGVYYGREKMRESLTEDNVWTIPEAVYYAVSENPQISDEELNLYLKKQLHDGSVTRMRFDEDMNILDHWGNRMIIAMEVSGQRVKVTCTSMGRDGLMGTEDDISNAFVGMLE